MMWIWRGRQRQQHRLSWQFEGCNLAVPHQLTSQPVDCHIRLVMCRIYRQRRRSHRLRQWETQSFILLTYVSNIKTTRVHLVVRQKRWTSSRMTSGMTIHCTLTSGDSESRVARGTLPSTLALSTTFSPVTHNPAQNSSPGRSQISLQLSTLWSFMTWQIRRRSLMSVTVLWSIAYLWRHPMTRWLNRRSWEHRCASVFTLRL